MAARKPPRDVDRVLVRLADTGLLLLHDLVRPSLSGLIAGEGIRGSWWSHPAGKRIYAAGEELGHHPDVMACKLVDGKITFVHRRLWPALSTIGRAKAEWQTSGLTEAAQTLLARVRADGLLRLEGGDSAAAKLLEARMLVLGERVHTDAGHHATELMSWPHWGRKVKLGRVRMTVADARRDLEIAVAMSAPGLPLPWQGKTKKPPPEKPRRGSRGAARG
jgi:hypothetical protein